MRIGLGAITAAVYGSAGFVDAHPEARTEARWLRCAWVAYDAPHEFLGDAEPALVRLTPPIEELTADYWLIQHPDMRTVPRVQRVAKWIVAAFKKRRPLR